MQPRFPHGFQNDVFISYAQVDNKPDANAREWVTQFETDLRTRLVQVSGCRVTTWRDDKLQAADRWNDEIADRLRNSAVLLAVLTPAYFLSEYCQKEREQFWRDAPDIGNKARVVKVAKTHVDLDSYPPDLKSLSEYRFYVEEPSGVCREFHLHEEPAVQRRYATRVDDVAVEVAAILKLLAKGAAAPAGKGAVFLAETSSDLEEPRAELRRNLVQLGYEVLPTIPLRLLTAPQIRETVAAAAAGAKAAIHPIGAAYGAIPELAGGASISRIQLEEVAARPNGLPRLIWIPGGVQPAETPQAELIGKIRKEWAGNPFQVIEGSLQKFETQLLDTLERRTRPAGPVDFQVLKKRPSVYLLSADAEDRKASRALRFWLHGQQLDVEWPALEGDAQKHLRHLLEDDGFLVYYGQAGLEWVTSKVAEIAAAESERTSPILSRAVFLADPRNDDKADFLTHDARVVEGYAPTPVEQALTAFVSEIRSGWPASSSPTGVPA